MIRHVSTRREDRVTDAVGCTRAFGTPFVLSGLVALSAGCLGIGGLDAAGVWPRLGVGVIGAAHLFGGLMLWLGTWSGATVRRSGVEWTERPALRPARRRHVPPGDVASVEVDEGRDSDGDATHRVVLVLTTGERLPLTRQTLALRVPAEEAAAAVARRLEIPDQLELDGEAVGGGR